MLLLYGSNPVRSSMCKYKTNVRWTDIFSFFSTQKGYVRSTLTHLIHRSVTLNKSFSRLTYWVHFISTSLVLLSSVVFFFLKKGNKCNSWNVNIAADLIFFFSFFIFWLISWFTITVLISAVACLLCFKERWVERESVFTLSNRRSQKAPCPSHTVHSVFLELELLTVWCIWRPLNSFVDIPSLLKKKPSVKNLSVLNE